ncbi:MAG: methyltransferase family protein [Woeseiaceae bacterium]
MQRFRRGAGRLWRWARWLIALAAIGFWTWLFLMQVVMPPMEHTVPFEYWYGNWGDVLIVSGVFLAFVLGFVWPRGGMQWRNAGVYSAFLISLFVEMFGIPLTIFILAPLFDLHALDFGFSESHLWAYLLDQAGLAPIAWGVYLVMTVSMGLIAVGLALVAVGWAQVFGAREELRTSGIYRFVRHPQYLGLILVIVALNIQWPTILTLLMAPVLIVMYVRQARREDKELEARFGGAFASYAARVPAFLPRLSRGRVLAEQQSA